jgi:hypothetical protein
MNTIITNDNVCRSDKVVGIPVFQAIGGPGNEALGLILYNLESPYARPRVICVVLG